MAQPEALSGRSHSVRQVLALTATATRKDVARIRKSLGIPDADLFRTPMRRDNLHIAIKCLASGKSGKRKRKLSAETALFHAVEPGR